MERYLSYQPRVVLSTAQCVLSIAARLHLSAGVCTGFDASSFRYDRMKVFFMLAGPATVGAIFESLVRAFTLSRSLSVSRYGNLSATQRLYFTAPPTVFTGNLTMTVPSVVVSLSL